MIFAPGLLRTTLLASLLSMGAQGGYYAITIWLPQFLRTTRGLTVLNSTGYLAVLISGFFASGYFSGMGPFLTEICPTAVRGWEQGFCYNFGRDMGALRPGVGGLPVAGHATGRRHGPVRRRGLRAVLHRRAAAAQDARPGAGGRCLTSRPVPARP